MSGKSESRQPSPKVAAKREAVRARILAAAWQMARDDGWAALSLRDLGARVGLRAQSLYEYFPSKHAILDAMFRQGYEQFLERAVPSAEELNGPPPDDWRATALAGSLAFFDFCTSDPVRYQLLFTRPIPGFEPSVDSMAVALVAYERTVGQLQRHGVTDPAGLDLWTAVITGLVSQQIANDPGGTRWRDLVPTAVDLMLAGKEPSTRTPKTRTRRKQ